MAFRLQRERPLARERTEKYLKQVQLWDRRRAIARTLSGGLKRRLMIARALMHATQTGSLGDIAPTGRKVRLASMIIYRFEQGRVAEEWEIFDKLGMYQQLRVAPPPA